MRKIIGLCFLTATLGAGAAHAQGVFIEKGDPSAISAMVGGGWLKDARGGGVQGGYSYRGVFDIGLDLRVNQQIGGDNKDLTSIGVMPFGVWHALRSDAEGMPISLSVTLGVQKTLYTGNTPVASPEAWGLLLGPSVYRRLEFGSNLVFIPELLVAYDFEYTRFYSESLIQASHRVVATDKGFGYSTKANHGARVLLRPNILYRPGNTSFLIVPYVGYQGGFAVGASFGALF